MTEEMAQQIIDSSNKHRSTLDFLSMDSLSEKRLLMCIDTSVVHEVQIITPITQTEDGRWIREEETPGGKDVDRRIRLVADGFIVETTFIHDLHQ